MDIIDCEFRDFRSEEFKYELIPNKNLFCHTWFTDGENIHAKRYSLIHIDENGRKYVHRYEQRYYLND